MNGDVFETSPNPTRPMDFGAGTNSMPGPSDLPPNVPTSSSNGTDTETDSKMGRSEDLLGNATLGRSFVLGETGILVGIGFGERGLFQNAVCVSGHVHRSYEAEAEFNGFEPLTTVTRKPWDLVGFGFTSRVGERSLEAEFAALAQEDEITETVYYMPSSFASETALLMDPVETEFGRALRSRPAERARICGDRYVSEVRRVARLVTLLRIDYASKEARARAEAKLDARSANLQKVFETLKSDAQTKTDVRRLTLASYQLGGDLGRLRSIFRDRGSVSCEPAQLQECERVYADLDQYANDTRSGFPSQFAPGATPGPIPIPTGLRPFADL